MTTMYDPYQMPSVAILIPNNGVTLADVVPAVVAPSDDSGDLLMRGRIRKWDNATAGGRFDVLPQFGSRIITIAFNVPGTRLGISMVDDTGVASIPLFISTTASGVFDLNADVLVPPGWHIACVTAGALTADGAIVIEFGQGLAPAVFDSFGKMGSESRPPGPPVP